MLLFMPLRRFIRHRTHAALLAFAQWAVGRRGPTMIGDHMMRWRVVRSPLLTLYVHQFIGDDLTHPHDHPSASLTYVLHGTYTETLYDRHGGVSARVLRAGDVCARSPWLLHRIEMNGHEPRAMTLFLMGPRLRRWGFMCPQGWRPWTDYVDPQEPGRIGAGCE